MIANRFPTLTDTQKKMGKEMSKWYGIIFGTEGLVIGIMCWLLYSLHFADFMIPGIALIVGLHFYPMEKIFKRSLDYYLATWTCIVAISGIIMHMNKSVTDSDLFAFVATGVGLATTSYGIYMLYLGRKYTIYN